MVSFRKALVLVAPGHFQIVVAKSMLLVYNMPNKEADTIVHTYPFPAKVINKDSTLLCQSGGAIFYGRHSPKWQQQESQM